MRRVFTHLRSGRQRIHAQLEDPDCPKYPEGYEDCKPIQLSRRLDVRIWKRVSLERRAAEAKSYGASPSVIQGCEPGKRADGKLTIRTTPGRQREIGSEDLWYFGALRFPASTDQSFFWASDRASWNAAECNYCPSARETPSPHWSRKFEGIWAHLISHWAGPLS
jgi:hypothetical protein